jgi:DNA-binding transcriptional ArsR family regulator
MVAAELKEAAPPTITITLRPEQAAGLEQAREWAKVMAAPVRIAILGALCARPESTHWLSDVTRATGLAYAQMERDLQQLIDAGLVRVVQWTAPEPPREPHPIRLAFNREALQASAQIVATLHQVTAQFAPAEPRPKRDERTRILEIYLRNGRLLGWPGDYKQQKYLLDEIAPRFEAARTYTEREVDTILKEVYPEDHCVIRRALVDLGYMDRDHGIYVKRPA